MIRNSRKKLRISALWGLAAALGGVLLLAFIYTRNFSMVYPAVIAIAPFWGVWRFFSQLLRSFGACLVLTVTPGGLLLGKNLIPWNCIESYGLDTARKRVEVNLCEYPAALAALPCAIQRRAKRRGRRGAAGVSIDLRCAVESPELVLTLLQRCAPRRVSRYV